MIQWKDVQGYEGLYMISESGVVLSGPKKLNRCGTFFERGEKILKPKSSTDGRLYVCLYKNGVSKNIRIHRLVATAFVQNPENKPEVNHKDGDYKNNHFSNLEWATRGENQRHAFANKLTPFMPKNHPSTSKPIIQKKDGSTIETYPSTMEACRKNNFRHSNISNCLTNKKQKAYGYEWEYAN